ncbi:MAG: hypothetical protein ACK5IA_12925, partial [Cyanobacteriota bacterium]
MAAGDLALVLHAHLPYVRSGEPGSLEEDWYFQALQECYLPLLAVLEAAAADPRQRPRLTLGLSPTLLSLLSDAGLNRRFLPWLDQRLVLLAEAPGALAVSTAALAEELKGIQEQWRACEGNLLPRFRRLQQEGVLDLITCGATHGYLPLLRDSPEAVRAQLLTAIREHQRLLGERPLGIWLPECAYYEDLDKLLTQCGLRYTLLDSHGLLHALPRPRFGVYAPICSPAGVAVFARDSESTLPVWSASQGYPGDGAYREFHRDLGWDLPEERLAAEGIPSRRPLGLKLHRVTAQGCPLEEKQPYEPAEAEAKVRQHARAYLEGRLAPAGGGGGAHLERSAPTEHLPQVGELEVEVGALAKQFGQETGTFKPPVAEQLGVEGGHQQGGSLDRGGQAVELGQAPLQVGPGVLANLRL